MGERFSIDLRGEERLTLDLATPVAGTNDYNKLTHMPSINGVTLEGEKSAEDLMLISEDTTAGWSEKTKYQPRRGEIIIYTDHSSAVDDLGNTVLLPGIKIGDGSAYVCDLPFVDAALRFEVLNALRAHAGNAAIHVTPEEKKFWNAKLNYGVTGEELIFTRN